MCDEHGVREVGLNDHMSTHGLCSTIITLLITVGFSDVARDFPLDIVKSAALNSIIISLMALVPSNCSPCSGACTKKLSSLLMRCIQVSSLIK